MSYHIYTTEAVILKKRETGEADRFFSFFTKDFGRLEIAAQGVRHLKSKLRYSLSGFSFVRISFVATGGEYWRLVDVEEKIILENIRRSNLKTRYVIGLFSVLLRLLQGEERDDGLWKELESFLFFLEKNKMGENDIKKITDSASLKIVSLLGYADGNEVGESSLVAVERALGESML